MKVRMSDVLRELRRRDVRFGDDERLAKEIFDLKMKFLKTITAINAECQKADDYLTAISQRNFKNNPKIDEAVKLCKSKIDKGSRLIFSVFGDMKEIKKP